MKRDFEESIKALDGEMLIQAYRFYRDTFNPLDYERCDVFTMIKAEIVRRLEVYDRLKGISK